MSLRSNMRLVHRHLNAFEAHLMERFDQLDATLDRMLSTLGEPPFVTYEMADGTDIGEEFTFTTELDWFDDRDREIRLIKRTYRLVSEEEIVLPHPSPLEEEADE